MDISAVTKNNFTAWVHFDDAEVHMRHLSREELREIYKKATRTVFSNHQKSEEFDPVKADTLLGQAAIIDWKGFANGDKPFACTPENIELLMRRHNSFAKFVNDVCVDLDYLVREGREETAKN